MELRQAQRKEVIQENKSFQNLFDNLPYLWEKVQLGDTHLFDYENGLWTGKKEPLIDCPVIRNTNFANNGLLNLSNVAIIPIEQRQLQKKRLIQGDIIIERSGGGPQQPVGRVALFNLDEGNYSFSNFTTRLRVLDETRIDPRFLHLYLHYFYISGQTEKLQNHTTGIRNLAFEDYKKSFILLPPPLQQSAIVKVLQVIQEAIQARRRELELECERKAGLMEYLFTNGTCNESLKQSEVGAIPESWQVSNLENFLLETQYGLSIPLNLSGRYPILRMSNLTEGFISYKDLKYVDLDNANLQKFKLNRGDVIFNRTNSYELVGKTSLFDSDNDVVFASYLIRLVTDEKKLRPKFLNWYLNWDITQSRLKSLASRGVSQSNISASKLQKFKISVPLSTDEQDEIVNILDNCYAKITSLENELVLLEELFKALLEEFMTGRLLTLPLIEEGVEV
jgi:type I restriction enzyme, S subunit